MNAFVNTLIFFALSLAAVHAKADSPSCLDEMNLGPEFREDRFFHPMRMKQGNHKGECVDNRLRRSVPLFSLSDRKLLKEYGIKMKPGYIYFGNFKHKNRYYIAEYPENSIDRTVLIFEKFIEIGKHKPKRADAERAMTGIVLTGHIQLRFLMKEGKAITLYPQYRENPSDPVKTRQIRDFSYAMFAIRPVSTSGQKFDPLGDGIHGGYIVSENFMSMYDVALAYRKYVAGETQVGQFRMEKSHFDAEAALKELIKRSDELYRNPRQTVYHTWFRNCVTSTFHGIDAGARNPSPKSRVAGVVSAVLRPMKSIGTKGTEWNPLFVLGNLERRGIIKHRSQSETISLNEEVCKILSPKDLGDMATKCAVQN